MEMTIREVAHHQCTGCGACYSTCPVDAIRMVSDKEGYPVPQINDDLCINCGKCLKICPVHTPKYENRPEPECYAVMANDQVRKVSSSGGVFTLLAEWVLSQGGYVCGAAYTSDYYRVEHIIINNIDELYRLRSSKYVQSYSHQVLREVKKLLDAGKMVLFTGTPCQVAAIYSYLGKPYDNLYTLDLVCHGVPSPMLYEKFVKEQEEIYGSKAKCVSFRDKRVVDWNHSILIEFENGEFYKKTRNECSYLYSFLNLLSVRESCGNCPFAKLPRQGDMTIADFWDVHLYKKHLDDRKGTSIALPNNPKGDIMLNVLRKKAVLLEKAPLEHAIKYNAQIVKSSVLHGRRNRFYDLLTTYQYPVSKAVDYGMNRKFDIGYVGWWYGKNYGSALTNYAMHEVLTGMGKSVLMLEWPFTGDTAPEEKPNTSSYRFANHFYEQSLNCTLKEYNRFNWHCDTFVVGSDQLWEWNSNRDVGTYYYFLDFVDDKHKKIAYSTSFGHETSRYPEEMELKLSYLLNRFDAVSVREESGVEICKKHFSTDAVQTIDPVFLCSMPSWKKAIDLSTVETAPSYVLAYILDPDENKINMVRHAAKEMRLPYYIIVDGQGDFERLKKETDDPNLLEDVEIADWLKYFWNASYVITDSFHGFCFSIIFRKNLTVIPNEMRGLARFESLFSITGLGDRQCHRMSELKHGKPWLTPIDYDQVFARMKPMMDYSRNWLVNALNSEKKPDSDKMLLLRELLEKQEKIDSLEAEIRQMKQQQ